jgi:hypothetical protein
MVMFIPGRLGYTLLYVSLIVTFGFALVASIQAWHIATGAARTRAGIFAIAFGFRDICWGIVYVVGLTLMWPEDQSHMFVTDEVPADFLLYILGTLLAVPLIAYGILHTHLFDIDLRIRWTIKQSTLAAIIVAIMFVVSESTERLLSSGLGNVASFLVAAAVVFLLTPLQRFAERVAIAAMPNTHNTPEYAAQRKSLVYESAITEALQDGEISERERLLLVRLRDSLGVSESQADSIEHAVQTRFASGLE